MALTKEDVRQFRLLAKSAWPSNWLSVSNYLGDEPGQWVVQLGFRETVRTPGFAPVDIERRYNVATLPARIERYGEASSGLTFIAMSSVYGDPTYGPAHTLASLLREGDELRPMFEIGNGTETLAKAGLTEDSAHLIIMRKGKFYAMVEVATGVFPISSPARFVRHPLPTYSI